MAFVFKLAPRCFNCILFIVISCQGGCVLGQGELQAGGWPWNKAGFQVPAICQRKRKEGDKSGQDLLLLFAVTMCVRYWTPKEVCGIAVVWSKNVSVTSREVLVSPGG